MAIAGLAYRQRRPIFGIGYGAQKSGKSLHFANIGTK